MADALLQMRRGIILRALRSQHPLALTQSMVEHVVGPFYAGDRGTLISDLNYLEEKGLVERHGATVARTTIVSWSVTPRGIDVVEGAIEEPGVQVNG